MTGLNGLTKSYEQFIGDFETTTDPEDCRVWLWAIADVKTLDVEYGLDIKSFCKFVSKFNSYIWFHNLGFDGPFLIDYLMKHNYIHVYDDIPDRSEFNTIISNMGKFYSIKICWGNGNRTEIRDSIKKLPMSAGMVAKSFNLEEIKGKIDYNKQRPIGYIPSVEEYDYVKTDVIIIAKALQKQISMGLTRLTVGADALAEYKDIVGKTLFSNLFPNLPLEIDNEIRRAYRGGFTYVNPRFAKRVLGFGQVYDVNSLYPYVMYTKDLPIGDPYCSVGIPKHIEEYPLWIANLTITAKLRKGFIPCIQIKGTSIFSSTEYQIKIDEPVNVVCCSVDFNLWQKHYIITVHEFNAIFYFKSQKGLFKSYVDKWSAVKANALDGIKTIAKLQLNSLYGKFGTNPNITQKIPILDDDGVIRLKLGKEESREPVYTAMAVFITAYAREITITAAQNHYNRFIYADTDSLHLLGGESVKLDVHKSNIGYWKHEYDFASSFYLRAKAYTDERILRYEEYQENGILFETVMETHIAGLPRDAANIVTYEHYKRGAKFGGKLSPKRVPGGIVLTDIGFTLSR